MRTKKIFRIGIFIIILICFQNPLSYILLGKKTTGTVLEIYRPYRSNGSLSRSTYPIAKFYTSNHEITFTAEQNLNYHKGDSVSVIYYPFHPVKAKIYSIGGLFTKSIIETVFCLLIWFAFIYSFPTIFDKPVKIVKKSSPLNKSKSKNYKLPPGLRIAYKVILVLFIILVAAAIILIIPVYFNNKISFRSLLIVLSFSILFLILMVREFRNV